MALTANNILQAAIDAGVADQSQLTDLFRLLRQDLLLKRQRQLSIKITTGDITATERAEIASNEIALSNLASLI